MALLSRAALRGRVPGALAAAALAAAAAAPPARAQLTQEQALAAAFRDAEVERRTAYLSDEQLAEADRLAGPDVEVESGIVTYYVAHGGAGPAGVAYFDAHRVRTHEEVLMVVVRPDGHVARVETVRFREPPEYRAPDGWLRQFDGGVLDEELSLGRAIRTITGATLTARAATRAVRRVLALHQVIRPLAGEAGS